MIFFKTQRDIAFWSVKKSRFTRNKTHSYGNVKPDFDLENFVKVKIQ